MVADYAKALFITPTYNDTVDTDLITDVEEVEATTPTIFYKFPLPVDLGDYTEEITSDPKMGTAFVIQTINGTLTEVSHESSKEITRIMRGKQVVIAELYNVDDSGNSKIRFSSSSKINLIFIFSSLKCRYTPFVKGSYGIVTFSAKNSPSNPFFMSLSKSKRLIVRIEMFTPFTVSW